MPGWSATWATTWSGRSSTCPTSRDDDQGHPDAVLAVIGQLAAFDHWRQRVVLIDNVVIDPALGRRGARRGLRRSRRPARPAGRRLLPPPRPAGPRPLPERTGPPPDVHRTMSDSLYEDAVRAAKEHVTAGDIFQVVLSQRFDLDSLGADPFDVYRVLRLVNPSPYLYFLRFPEVTVVGASPEPMVRLRDGTVVSRPIAGSRRRGPPPRTTPGSRPSWSRTPRRWPST